MANSLGGYDLTWFAQESLLYLMQALGFGSRVHRGYEPEPKQKGNTITIAGPAGFTAQDAPSSAQDLDAREVNVTLDYWKDVTFGVTDRELNGAPDRIIEDHIQPAAYALANDIDARLAGLYSSVPYAVDIDDGNMLSAIVGGRKILRSNGVPLMTGNIYLGVDAETEADLLTSTFMHSSGVADGANQQALVEGSLGRRFGVEMFANGNIPTHTSGTVISAGTDAIGALNGAHAKGATTISVDGLSGSETFKEGDAFTIAGNDQRYVVTADAALTTGANAAVGVYPALVQAYADNAAVTFENGSGGSNHADSFSSNLLFHRNFATLATAPLAGAAGSEQARKQGIEVENILDEQTGIALRAMRWYEASAKKSMVSLDILYGFGMLDPQLAVRLRRDV